MTFDLLGSLAGDPSAPQEAVGVRPGAGEAAPQCSRKGCRAAAVWLLEWNNPKVHTPERRKTWTACDEHREHLGEFLRARGFLRDIRPLAAGSADSAGDQDAAR